MPLSLQVYRAIALLFFLQNIVVCVEEWVDPLTLVAYEGTTAAAAAKQKEVRKDDGDGNDAIRIGGVNNRNQCLTEYWLKTILEQFRQKNQF